jgi:hypothetical protein
MNIPDLMSFFLAPCDICLAGAAVGWHRRDLTIETGGSNVIRPQYIAG